MHTILSAGDVGSGTHRRSPTLMLVMATIGFAVNFWAWALLSPLGPLFRETGTLGALTESDVALLVAVPVVVGSLGRIVVGALTDRYGGRLMFPVVSAMTIVPVLFIAFFAQSSYAALLVGGFFLGIAGTAFAIGVPFVNAWFPAGAAWTGRRRLRCGNGWHRDQRVDHGEALHRARRHGALPHRGRRAGGVRRRRLGRDARRPRARGPDDRCWMGSTHSPSRQVSTEKSDALGRAEIARTKMTPT